MRLYTLAMTVVVFASANGEDFFEALFHDNRHRISTDHWFPVEQRSLKTRKGADSSC